MLPTLKLDINAQLLSEIKHRSVRGEGGGD